ncbi:hypothetical protein ACFY04_18710 [Streptomyces sp. NPDC001549]|uniref:hypothetical protein n=1 Tax=Streptomyces sp. NPDC001549 TaxID=3364586 RepID=UPI0036A9C50A
MPSVPEAYTRSHVLTGARNGIGGTFTPDGRMPAVAVHHGVGTCHPDAAGKAGPVRNGHRAPVGALRLWMLPGPHTAAARPR